MYQVSNFGRIRTKNGKIRKNMKTIDGRMRIQLSKNGEMRSYYIHRLVAEAFLINPENKKEIKHIDENKENNAVDNLKWCDRFDINENKTGKSVLQYSKKNVLIKEWASQSEASRRLKIPQCHISSCCNGKLKTAGGYVWKFN